MTERHILVLGRHGVAPKNPDGSSQDSITEASIVSMYNGAKETLAPVVKELGITPADTFLRWTGRVRTDYTARANAIGALGLQRKDGTDLPPQSSADLANFKYDGVAVEEDVRLNFGKPLCNMPVYKATGGVGNVDFWLANPTARVHNGEAIEPYVSMKDRTGHAVREAVRRITDDSKRFGYVATHATVVEPTLIHLVNSGCDTPVERAADIGGCFGQEERAVMTIDETEGGLYTATLNIKGQDHKVDLQKLLG